MDRNRVKHVAEVEPSPGQGASLLELWHGAGQIVWHHAGMCGLSTASRQFGAEPAATPAGMVLWRRRQKREEASGTGREHVFWAIAAVDTGVVAC